MATDATNCDARDCNQPTEHPGPHGHEVTPGLVLGPWSDLPRQSFEDGDPTSCNSCGKPLTLHPKRCRASCICGQRIAFGDRGMTQTILPSLYPSRMTDPKQLREFGQYKLGQAALSDTLKLRFGLICQVEFDKSQADAATVHAHFIETEVEPLERRQPWWKFWR